MKNQYREEVAVTKQVQVIDGNRTYLVLEDGTVKSAKYKNDRWGVPYLYQWTTIRQERTVKRVHKLIGLGL